MDIRGVSGKVSSVPATARNTTEEAISVSVNVENGRFEIQKSADKIIVSFYDNQSLFGNYKLTITPQSISIWKCTSGQFSGDGVVTDSAASASSPEEYRVLLRDGIKILKYNVLPSAGENAGGVRQVIAALGASPYKI